MNNNTPAKFDAAESPSYPDPFYGNGAPRADAGAASSPHAFLGYLLRYFWVPLLTLALAVGGVVIYVLNSEPTYVSDGKMWETEKMRLPGEMMSDDMQDYISTQMRLLKSDKQNDLALKYMRDHGRHVPMVKPSGLKLLMHSLSHVGASNSLVMPLDIKLTVKQAPKTTVIEMSAYSTNSAYTQDYLNALMAAFLDYKKHVRTEQSGDTMSSLSGQAITLKNQLDADQNTLTDFERTNNLAVLQAEANIAGEYLTRLKTEVTGLQLESEFLNATSLEPDWIGQGKNITSGFVINSHPGAWLPGAAALPGTGATTTEATASSLATDRQTAWTELEALKQQRAALSENLRPEHPKIVKLDQDIAQGEHLIDSYRSQHTTEVNAARNALKLSSESVQESIKQWNKMVLEASIQIAEAERLKTNVVRTEALYDRMVMLLQNVDINREVDREFLAVFEPASDPVRSFRFELILLALALVVGTGWGLGIVYLIQTNDDKFSSVSEVDDRFGGSVVGQVPNIRKRAKNGYLPLLESENQSDTYAESYRSLRSALLFLPFEKERPKTILITSALPNEGKSTIAANLAKALAFGGSKVLLVDGDLRKGRLHDVIGRPPEPGLIELILKPQEASRIVHSEVLPNLSFVSRGGRQGHPGDLLLKPELTQILADWRQQYDYVLIDSCPVFAADDVSTLANKVDGTLFVVRRHFSSGAAVREALESLLRRRTNVLGLIFNRAKASGHTYRYFKHADYHYKAGANGSSSASRSAAGVK